MNDLGGPRADHGPLAELLNAVGRGDRDAFDQLYRQMLGPVSGLIQRVVRDPSLTEEVAQDAMTQIWCTADRFDQAKGTPQAWIMTIAHHQAIDRVRAERAARERETRYAAACTHIAYDEVAETVEARLEAQRVRQCMHDLTDLQRESVTLAYYDGYTYPQVARLLDSPLGTVKTRMRDGLARLRELLRAG